MSGRVLCLGDPLLELVSDRPLTRADAFVPRLGGAVANVAAVAGGLGARVALAGGVGADPWGAWLAERLAAAGVDTGRLAPVPGGATPVAFRTADGSLAVGEAVGGVGALDGLPGAVAESGALLFGSESLMAAGDRSATMGAREVALDSGVPVLFYVGLRLAGWRSTADAAASANACVPGALLVHATAAEAAVLTGEEDPERAAIALLKAGARLVVLTLGADGVMLRGELRADVEDRPVGSDEALSGVLVGRLALSDFYPPVVAASLREAVAARGSR